MFANRKSRDCEPANELEAVEQTDFDSRRHRLINDLAFLVMRQLRWWHRTQSNSDRAQSRSKPVGKTI